MTNRAAVRVWSLGACMVVFAGLVPRGAAAARSESGPAAQSAAARPESGPAAQSAAAPEQACRVVSSHTVGPASIRLGDEVEVAIEVSLNCAGDDLHRRFILGLPAWPDAAGANGAREAARGFGDQVHALGLGLGLALGHASPPEEIPPSAGPAGVESALAGYGPSTPGSTLGLLLESGRALFYADENFYREHLVLVDHPGVPPTSESRLRFELQATLDLGIEVTHICIGGGCPVLADVERIDLASLTELEATLLEIAVRPSSYYLEWVEVRQQLGATVDYVFGSESVPPTRMGAEIAGDFIEWRIVRPPNRLQFSFRARPFSTGPVRVLGALTINGRDSSGGQAFDADLSAEPVTVLAEPARPSTCNLLGQAEVDPSTVYLSQMVTSTLTFASDCPAIARDVDVVVALDNSASMEGLDAGGMLGAAQEFADAMDLSRARIGVLSFGTLVDVRTPLTSDAGDIRAALQTLAFAGDTSLSLAIDAGRELLAPRRTGALPALVIVTDGKVRDQPAEAAAWARATGIRIAVICYNPTLSCHDDVLDIPSSQYLFLATDTGELRKAFQDLARYLSRPDIDRLSVTQMPNDGLAYSGRPHKDMASIGPNGEMVWNRADPLMGRTELVFPMDTRGVGEWPSAEWIEAFWVDSSGGVGGVRVNPATVLIEAPPAAGPCRSDSLRHAAPGAVEVGEVVTVTTTIDLVCDQTARGTDVVFAVDRSFSMGTLGRLQNAVRAVDAFLVAAGPADLWAGLVAFNEQVTTVLPLAPPGPELRAAMEALRPDGSTDVGRAIDASVSALAGGRPDAVKVLVLLTDGANSPTGVPILDAAGRAHEAGVIVAAVCAGGRCDPNLASAATGPEFYFNVNDGVDMSGLFERLGATVTGLHPSAVWVDEVVSQAFGSGMADPDPIRPGPGQLRWQLGLQPPGGHELRHELTAQRSGRRHVSLWSRLRYTIIGATDGELYLPPTMVDVAVSATSPLPTAGPVPTVTPEPTDGPPTVRVYLPANRHPGPRQ